MNYENLIELFDLARRRYHLVGDRENGVVVGLELEGRFFTLFEGQVVNRVNEKAFSAPYDSKGELPLIPGGDTLWPSPEGTTLGYHYSTGKWRIPPSLINTRYQLVSSSQNTAVVRAFVDLVNNQGLGLPTIFERSISVFPKSNYLEVKVKDRIEYIGAKSIQKGEFLLAPWVLGQFVSGPGCFVVFSQTSAADVWDLYEPSDSKRKIVDGLWHVETDASQRFQIGIAREVPWIEFHNPGLGLKVRRQAETISQSESYIDIIDAPPPRQPSDKLLVRYSVYSDPSGFMEVEAVGGSPPRMTSGTAVSLSFTTTYSRIGEERCLQK